MSFVESFFLKNKLLNSIDSSERHVWRFRRHRSPPPASFKGNLPHCREREKSYCISGDGRRAGPQLSKSDMPPNSCIHSGSNVGASVNTCPNGVKASLASEARIFKDVFGRSRDFDVTPADVRWVERRSY